jgi:hypothetical protein
LLQLHLYGLQQLRFSLRNTSCRNGSDTSDARRIIRGLVAPNKPTQNSRPPGDYALSGTGSGGRYGDVLLDQFRPHAVCGEHLLYPSLVSGHRLARKPASNPFRRMESGNSRSDNRCFFIPRVDPIAHSFARSAEADFRTERVLRAANCRPRCSLKMKKKKKSLRMR